MVSGGPYRCTSSPGGGPENTPMVKPVMSDGAFLYASVSVTSAQSSKIKSSKHRKDKKDDEPLRQRGN